MCDGCGLYNGCGHCSTYFIFVLLVLLSFVERSLENKVLHIVGVVEPNEEWINKTSMIMILFINYI